MSARREHLERINKELQYIEKFNFWLDAEPPMLLFWRWKKWRDRRPVLG